MNKQTQSERIKNHLQEHGSITALEAMSEYGIMRLASRMSDLKKDGYPFEKRMVVKQNRYGDSVVVAEYYIGA